MFKTVLTAVLSLLLTTSYSQINETTPAPKNYLGELNGIFIAPGYRIFGQMKLLSIKLKMGKLSKLKSFDSLMTDLNRPFFLRTHYMELLVIRKNKVLA
jgi:hypothetical protein